MCRTYVNLRPDQAAALEARQAETGSDKAETIRRAVDAYFTVQPPPVRISLLEAALDRAGIVQWSGFRDNTTSPRVSVCFAIGGEWYALRAVGPHVDFCRMNGFRETVLDFASTDDPDFVQKLADLIARRKGG